MVNRLQPVTVLVEKNATFSQLDCICVITIKQCMANEGWETNVSLIIYISLLKMYHIIQSFHS